MNDTGDQPRPDDSKPLAQAEPAASAGDEAAATDQALPRELPILPVRNVVVFPGTVVPLTIGRQKSKRLIDDVLAGNKMLCIFAQRREDVEDPKIDDVYRVGTVANVLKLLRVPEGGSTLLVHGLVRAGLEDIVATEPYWRAVIHPHEDAEASSLEIEALAYSARRTAERVIELSPNVPPEAQQVLGSIEKPGSLADFLAANLSLGIVQKQELLETFDVADRLRKVIATLNNQLEVLELSQKIQADVRQQMDKSQREYYLHEQLKAIQKELGESDARTAAIEGLKQRVAEAGMPEAVLKEAERELERLGRIPQASPEYGVITDYLSYLSEMPWSRETDDNLDLERAERILNEDHYGLEKVKRRIVEYLAVRKLNPSGKGPILCFVGPPGVGKTSLGQSIARALGRNFIRISLGGAHDEADIRGHRRTYIGAVPGRIVQELRKSGSRNPVLMLDELDKMGADFRGDPAAALLEVLDPAQNNNFTDHYLSVPFDLSKVLFIGTANYIDPVAPALKDRMEILDLPGYTTTEKIEIAQRYLVPRQLQDNGLAEQNVTFDQEALRTIIESHTREAGVRNLERSVGTVCRGIAAKIAREREADISVEPADLEEYLGPPRHLSEVALRVGVPGVATGLAYTPVGGEIIFVEATAMPGRGQYQLTGQIGDVMRESAQAALSLLRARASDWGLSPNWFQENDLHIHVPAGAIPKDGPSAGVAIYTALVSLVTGQPARPEIGMTGEITLRGLVLPIGGVKEKVLGAHRAGLKTVVLPARNQPDLHEIPKNVLDDMRFVFAETVLDVLAAAFPAPVAGATRRRQPIRTKASRKRTTASRAQGSAPKRRAATAKAASARKRGRVEEAAAPRRGSSLGHRDSGRACLT